MSKSLFRLLRHIKNGRILTFQAKSNSSWIVAPQLEMLGSSLSIEPDINLFCNLQVVADLTSLDWLEEWLFAVCTKLSHLFARGFMLSDCESLVILELALGANMAKFFIPLLLICHSFRRFGGTATIIESYQVFHEEIMLLIFIFCLASPEVGTGIIWFSFKRIYLIK